VESEESDTMKSVRREELMDYVTWTETKPAVFPAMLRIKAARRVHIGPYLTLLFENADTVRYQIQEMLRVECIVREADIRHELETYNELLGGPGELGATLMIEIDDPAERELCLPRWLDLPARIYVELEGGERVFARVDERQVGETRVSSVQYLKFDTGGRCPIALGTDYAELATRVLLTLETQAALSEDLGT
jgi:hypothetical protein